MLRSLRSSRKGLALVAPTLPAALTRPAPALLLAATLIATLALGCSEAESPGEPPPHSTPVVAPPDRVVNKNQIREELKAKVDLPDYYPADAPIYPGTSTNNAGRRAGRVTAVFSTEDAPERVREYVEAKLASTGWGDISNQEMPNGSVIHAMKGEREISVLVSYMDEGTEYQVTMMIVAVDP